MNGRKLKYGDTIGVILPAGPVEAEAIKQHIQFLRDIGFKIKEGKHIYDKLGYLAGTDEDRARDLMDMFLDKDVDAIMCYRGGYGTMRILQYIDYTIIKRNPKIFVGYSDITTLLNTFYKRCCLVTFHGPMVGSNFEDEVTLSALINTLMYGTEPYSITNPKDSQESYQGNYSTEGILVGGNLSLICSTLGTPYEIDTSDRVLFIEDVGEVPYRIDRMLTQLILANKLQKCRGFILGQFTDCTADNPQNSLSLDQVISDRLLFLRKPTVMNFMSGHDYPKLTLPIGAKIRINTHSKKIEVLESVVRH